MDVAVAGVEDVGDAQAVRVADVRDRREDLGQPRSRDDAVLRAVVGREPADRAERLLAALPEPARSALVARQARLADARARGTRLAIARRLRLQPSTARRPR